MDYNKIDLYKKLINIKNAPTYDWHNKCLIISEVHFIDLQTASLHNYIRHSA